MPVGQSCPDEGMPPLVRTSKDVKLAGQNTLWELGNVECKGEATEQIKYKNSWQKDLDFITVETLEHNPVDGGDKSINSEGYKIDQSEDNVLLFVHLVHEQCSGGNEAKHCCHVEGT